MKEATVIIVGAGPAGLAAAASLAALSIPSLILERDDCIAPHWRKRSYDRLRLHLAKGLCELPHYPYPSTTPTYVPKDDFVRFLDDYAARFEAEVHLSREVRSAGFDDNAGKWRVSAMNLAEEQMEEYVARYLVIASGENDIPHVPDISGMDTFPGKIIHSSKYRNGSDFKGKDILVVEGGNSGMEIAYDLCNFGARTSIVIRSPLHLVTKEINWLFAAIFLKNILPDRILDALIVFLCKLKFGDTSKYGIRRPVTGPALTPGYPIVDVGTYQKIKTGEIQVLPSLTSVQDNLVTFSNGKTHHFDAIILATGYRSVIKNWLKGGDDLIDENGMSKQKYPNHWKGKKGIYCVGLAWRGLYGIAEDALSVARDINVGLLKCGSLENGVAFN